ncbi:alpha-tocopherol transfer protein-like [Centruroides sculpturatus]|uniref:alpha-tocopherol transfer protein-like n=1 Tax=Centruroides sculpturatus TaxID=218467 RepID=UPI000C6DD7CF|nr:alpha-tocopherol transfer protein-like [Centruroides sculpturatus]
MNIKDSIFPEEKDEFPWDEKALIAFKKAIKDQRIKCRMDDIFLLGFLRSRKFDLQRSLQQLKNYYNIRVNYPEYFKDLLPSKLEHVFNLNVVQYLPSSDQNGSYIYIFRFGKWDTSAASVTDVIRAIMLFTDLQLNFHRTQVNKIVCVIDAAGLNLLHFYHFSPRAISALVMLLVKDSYPIRYKALHYVNMNVIIKAILSVLLPLLPHKLRKRVHLHSNVETLHEFISPDCLPLEFGGNLPSFDPTEANNMLRSNEEFFKRNEEYVKLYEEETNKNFSQGTFRYVGEDFEEEKIEKFIEKSEDKFKSHCDDPEAFLACMQEDSELEMTRL